MALLRLFLETVADREVVLRKNYWEHCYKQRKSITAVGFSFRNKVPLLDKMKDSLEKNVVSLEAFFINLLAKSSIALKAPYSLLHQMFCRSVDANSLHPPMLSGEKVFFFFPLSLLL